MPRGASHLPSELWVDIFSYLPAGDLARALGVCKSWASLGEAGWRAACFRRWPRWSALAGVGDGEVAWRRLHELFQLREDDARGVPDVQRITSLQHTVTPRHRAILTEWLCEVSLEWQLDTVLPFKAVSYLDCYLEQNEVQELSRWGP